MERDGASASTIDRFVTTLLTKPNNLAVRTDVPICWIHAGHDRRPLKSITLDLESSE